MADEQQKVYRWVPELPEVDDKNLVIVAAAAIALVGLFQLEPDSAASLANSIVSGLFGVAVGRATAKVQ